MTPLVSILIPAYNAEQWICETLQSVVRQTWRRKEVIVVDDGSTDRTLSIARQFASPSVKVISQENRGGGIARNTALSLAQGDYVQYLDHDDLLAPDKVARQVEAMSGGDDERTLLSGSFSKFFYCVQRAKPVRNVMCQDLHPVEFFIHKLNDEAAWLQIGAYLFSRRLIEMAGPWYEKQSTDDDGNYVDRVVMSCERIHFVSEARSYWRIGNTRSAGHRNTKQMHEAAFHTTVHSVQQLLSLENSDRTTRRACDFSDCALNDTSWGNLRCSLGLRLLRRASAVPWFFGGAAMVLPMPETREDCSGRRSLIDCSIPPTCL